jgi:hypothetical protein
MSAFPELPVTPGEYACRWFFDKGTCPGEIELQGNRLPTLDIFDDHWTVGTAGAVVHSFGSSRDFARLIGKLRSNHDVVLIDAHLDAGLLEWAFGRARFAIVGLGVDAVPEDRYEEILLQVTGADQFFGASPVKQVSWPKGRSHRAKEEYSVEVNPESRQRWRDRTERLVVTCFYQRRFPLHHYRFEVAFAPVVQLTADAPLTLDEWITRWVQPLVDVVSLACRHPQRLAWLTVHNGKGKSEVSGVVFGGGIAQAPFQAGYNDEWRRTGRLSLFTLTSLPTSFPVLLRRWRKLTTGASPFLSLYRLVLLNRELPLRARYLYLIQALEALHGHEHRAAEDSAQRQFTKAREKLLADLQRTGIDAGHIKFLRDNWSSRRLTSLAERLSDLINRLPPGAQRQLEQPEMAAVAKELEADYHATALHEQFARLRNDLSHGQRNYDDHDLDAWVKALELICRAHLMRLLGFKAAAIERALSSP